MNNEYILLFESDEEGWCASVPDLPGCLSDGNTMKEAQARLDTFAGKAKSAGHGTVSSMQAASASIRLS